MNHDELQRRCLEFLSERMAADPAHDLSHVRRVVSNTLALSHTEQAELSITLPAAWLHDCVSVPKDSDQRSQASRLAAREAVRFLETIDYPAAKLEPIAHAIEAHSFSAGIAPRTLEARIVQDADRLEALGAIGIARCLLTGGAMGTALYETDDPFSENREPDDRRYTIDHFYCKLFKLPETMQTEAGRAEAQRRADYMREFLERLREEIDYTAQGVQSSN
jgi:uncharacterized protein